jgi:hypothetical protein
VSFSCFASPVSFSAETRVSGPSFMFCAPRVVSRGIEGVRSCFHVLRSRTCFCVASVSGPISMFCAPGLIFDGPEGDEFRFHVLRSQTFFASGSVFLFYTP